MRSHKAAKDHAREKLLEAEKALGDYAAAELPALGAENKPKIISSFVWGLNTA
jgi:hypothetical protein